MPGRNSQSQISNYRYTFNGQEKTPELAQNSTSAEFWQFDSRIAIRWNPDPIVKEYESPYSTFSGNPILRCDPSGDTSYLPINSADISCKQSNDNGTTSLTVGGIELISPGISNFNNRQYYKVQPNLYCTKAGVNTSGSNTELLTQIFITTEQLKKIFSNGTGLDDLSSTLNSKMYDFGFKTPEALAHFLSQTGEETGGFSKGASTENLNYSASRLVQVWPKRFSLEKTSGKELASEYANNSEKLANYVYAGRMGNGDAASGDGYLFRGRGLIQLTGRENYSRFQSFYNARYKPLLTLTADPGPVASDHNLAVISALWFFQANVMSHLNLQNASVEKVTQLTNGGQTNLELRKNYYNSLIKILK